MQFRAIPKRAQRLQHTIGQSLAARKLHSAGDAIANTFPCNMFRAFLKPNQSAQTSLKCVRETKSTILSIIEIERTNFVVQGH